jgi:uroporphyrinogen decarboxylase
MDPMNRRDMDHMNERERFRAIMNYGPFDRPLLWHFGFWRETQKQWREQGLADSDSLEEMLGMDSSFLGTKTALTGIVNLEPLWPGRPEIVEENDEYRLVRHQSGSLSKVTKLSADAMSHTIEYCMQPTRESWEKQKPYLRPAVAERLTPGWETKVHDLTEATSVVGLRVPGLYRFPEFWLGVEGVTYMMYDEPDAFADMIETMVSMYEQTLAPVLERGCIDYVYVFEDCCGGTGPLISPALYERFLAHAYRRLFDLCHAHGALTLMDSDGKVDDLISHWLASGMDILFPVEVGTWKTDPVELRRRFGKSLRMVGGVNKHVIGQGEKAIRSELEHLVPLVEEGGYIPMPDHKIPPDCTLNDFKRYVTIFKEIFFPAG